MLVGFIEWIDPHENVKWATLHEMVQAQQALVLGTTHVYRFINEGDRVVRK